MLSLFFLLVTARGEASVMDNSEQVASACEEVELACPKDSIIVVSEAAFVRNSSLDPTCEKVETQTIPSDKMDIWHAVVQQCSGVKGKSCVFNLDESLPESRSWGKGWIMVRYTCEQGVSSYCGGTVSVTGPGYLSSPAYPRYYLGGRDCVWTLTAGAGQQVWLTLVDLSLRGSNTPRCEDSVRVMDNSNILLDECGELDKPEVVISQSEEVEVRLRTQAGREQLYPRRGLLMRYRPVGCATPPAPADGFVQIRNKSHAELACSSGHVFMSTLSSVKPITCRSNVWSSPLEHCVSVSFLMQYGNQSVVSALLSSYAHLSQEHGRSGQYGVEVVATVVVGALLLASLILAVLLFLKHRRMDSVSEWQVKEDMVNLQESASGNDLQESVQRY